MASRSSAGTASPPATEAALRRALADRERLVAELHHRVRTSLQMVPGLLALELAGRTDPATTALLRRMETRVQVMAEVHDQLRSGADPTHVDMQRYLRAVVGIVKRVSGPLARKVRAQVACRGEAWPVGDAMRCGLLVNELASCGCEPAAVPGRVSVTIGRTRAARLRVVVTCHNCPDVTRSRPDHPSGELSRGLAADLGSELAVTTRRGGTTFRVEFDRPAPAAR
jgi:two-component sensor histidine kinase